MEVPRHVGPSRGFTLIESMIAMIVFVAALLALVPLIVSENVNKFETPGFRI